MRAMALLLLVGCAGPDDTDTDEGAGAAPLQLDLESSWGPEPPVKGRVRAVHLRFDLGEVALAFNETGVVVADGVPPGGATPLLPVPSETASLQAWKEGVVVAETDDFAHEGGAGSLVVWGTVAAPESLEVPLDPSPPASGRFRARLIHTAPGTPSIGLVDPIQGELTRVDPGGIGADFSAPTDTGLGWALDLTGDGVPDLPLSPFDVPDLDSLGQRQVVDIYAIPTGSVLPGQVPIPALLLVPLDAPDGIVVVAPSAG
jgi:hypothetical protein